METTLLNNQLVCDKIGDVDSIEAPMKSVVDFTNAVYRECC